MHCRALITALITTLWVHAALASDDVLGKGRVVLVPPNLGVRAASEVEPGLDPVWRQILEHFAAGDQRVSALERNSAAALWREVALEVKADPNLARSGNAPMYGMMAKAPLRGFVGQSVRKVMEAMYAPGAVVPDLSVAD